MSLTFTIVEGRYPTVDYEEFKKDFLNEDMLVEDIRRKHELSPSRYNELRAKVCEDLGISRKPTRGHSILKHYNKYFPENMNIQKAYTGGYYIVKVKNKKTLRFGRYEDIETARMVRDKLAESDWDLAVGDELMEKYAIKNDSLAKNRAKSLYPKFEEVYFHSDLSMSEILKKYHISSNLYGILLNMIKKNYGEGNRWTLRRRYCGN